MLLPQKHYYTDKLKMQPNLTSKGSNIVPQFGWKYIFHVHGEAVLLHWSLVGIIDRMINITNLTLKSRQVLYRHNYNILHYIRRIIGRLNGVSINVFNFALCGAL